MNRVLFARDTRVLFCAIAVCLAGGAWLGADADDAVSTPLQASPTAAVPWGKVVLVQMRVADIDRSIAFYRDKLGFEMIPRNPDLPTWVKFKTPFSNVVIGLGVAEPPHGSGSTSINMTVKNCSQARHTLEARGVTFTGPTMTVPGVVSLAEFSDPDGNRFRLAGPAE